MMSKYLQLAAELQAEITKGTYTEKLPTEHLLAQTYGVSRQTVRQALDCLVARGLITKRQGSGSKIVLQRSLANRNIAVIVPWLNDYIFPLVVQDMQLLLSQRNFSTLLFAHQQKISLERTILQGLLKQPVSGVVAVGVNTAFPSPNLDLYEKLSKARIPVIFLYTGYRELADSVVIGQDNYGGGYDLTRHLIALGHVKIAGLFMSDLSQGIERYHGFISAMRDAGLPLPDHATCWYTSDEERYITNFGHMEMIEHFIDYYLRDCTAVICYNDRIADLLIRVLLHRGLRVPQDVSVVSFDNSSYSDLCPVHITSLEPIHKHIGQLVAQTLLDKIDGKPCGSTAIPWKLVRKQSC